MNADVVFPLCRNIVRRCPCHNRDFSPGFLSSFVPSYIIPPPGDVASAKSGSYRQTRAGDCALDTIRQWLHALDLDQYAANFESNDIDLALLNDVDDQTLKDIGIASVGHRLRLRAAIRQRTDSAAQPPPRPTPRHSRAGAVGGTAPGDRDVLRSVGSTALSARMDPEDLRDIIATYQKTVAETVRRFEAVRRAVPGRRRPGLFRLSSRL